MGIKLLGVVLLIMAVVLVSGCTGGPQTTGDNQTGSPAGGELTGQLSSELNSFNSEVDNLDDQDLDNIGQDINDILGTF